MAASPKPFASFAVEIEYHEGDRTRVVLLRFHVMDAPHPVEILLPFAAFPEFVEQCRTFLRMLPQKGAIPDDD